MRKDGKVFVSKESGKNEVRIEYDGYSLVLLTAHDDLQWTGFSCNTWFSCNDELLKLIRDSFDEYFSKNKTVR